MRTITVTLLTALLTACAGTAEQQDADPASNVDETTSTTASALSASEGTVEAPEKTCDALRNGRSIGRFQVNASPKPKDVVAYADTYQGEDGKPRYVLRVEFTSIANPPAWQAAGVTPSSESFWGFNVDLHDARGVGVYRDPMQYSGGRTVECPGNSGQGGSAASQFDGVMLITGYSSKSVQGVFYGGGQAGTFDAPIITNTPTIPSLCCVTD